MSKLKQIFINVRFVLNINLIGEKLSKNDRN